MNRPRTAGDRFAATLTAWVNGLGPRASRALLWVVRMAHGMARARTFGLAAEMSFWLFLSLIPLAAVAGMVAARFASHHGAMTGPMVASMPPEVGALIRDQVKRVANWQGRKVAPVAVVTFVWLAASGVHSVFDALEVQTAAARPWWKKRLLALATCVGLSVGLGIIGLLAVGLQSLEVAVGRVVPHARAEGTMAGGAVRFAMGLALAVGMVAALYRVGIPREARRRIPILPGTLVAVGLITVLGWGYRLFISTMGAGDAYQGGLAVIGVTLTTLWLFSVALLLGAQLNLLASQRQAGHSTTGVGLARHLPRPRARWPNLSAFSSRPTSPRAPSEPSTGPSPSPSGSAGESP
jgi:membrane protein